MSWHRAVWLSCDGGGCTLDTHDYRQHTVDAARRWAARRLRWTFRAGEDLCPVCSALRDPAAREALLAAARAGLPAGDPATYFDGWDLTDRGVLVELAQLAGWLE